MEIETPKVQSIKWELEMKCSVCQSVNKVTYSPHAGQETFTCAVCKGTNRVLITFIAMPETMQDMMTMMIKPGSNKIGNIDRGNRG